MCGIVGYIGKNIEIGDLFHSLKLMEYRGYDSAGMAVYDAVSGHIQILKVVGKLHKLKTRLSELPLHTSIGLGHTRWATHGPSTEVNAHPHRVGKVTMVHNGIFENASELKVKLLAEGYIFQGDTDSEIAAGWFDWLWKQQSEGEDRLINTIQNWKKSVEGSYAVAIIHDDMLSKLIVVKEGSPLVFGRVHGEAQGWIVGSSVSAILHMTDRYVVMKDGQWALLSIDQALLYDADGRSVSLEEKVSDWNAHMLDKGDYQHFLEKEIAEHAQAVRGTLHQRIQPTEPYFSFEELGKIDWHRGKSVHFVACGSSYYAAMTAFPRVEEITHRTPHLSLASELMMREHAFQPDVIFVAISQSGETADVISCVKKAKEVGAQVIGLINVPESTLTHLVDVSVPLRAGAEVSVASTKVLSSSIVAIEWLAWAQATALRSVPHMVLEEQVAYFQTLPIYLEKVYQHILQEDWYKFMHQIASMEHFLFLGRRSAYGVALEGALKLKELGYVHAEAYAGGELKHGPLALIGLESLVTFYCLLDDDTKVKMLNNMAEVTARHQPPSRSIVITTLTPLEFSHDQHTIFRIPKPKYPGQEILGMIMWFHYLAFMYAKYKGYDIDQPRNLAKSVTVE